MGGGLISVPPHRGQGALPAGREPIIESRGPDSLCASADSARLHGGVILQARPRLSEAPEFISALVVVVIRFSARSVYSVRLKCNASSQKARRARAEAQEPQRMLVSIDVIFIMHELTKVSNVRPCKTRKVKWYAYPGRLVCFPY